MPHATARRFARYVGIDYSDAQPFGILLARTKTIRRTGTGPRRWQIRQRIFSSVILPATADHGKRLIGSGRCKNAASAQGAVIQASISAGVVVIPPFLTGLFCRIGVWPDAEWQVGLQTRY
jgi:hypothetical protein